MMTRIGLIAGNRRFPLLFASEAKKKNYSVVAVAIKGETDPNLSNFVEKIYWIGLEDFSRAFKVFQDENITDVVMAGQISPRQLFRPKVRNSAQIKSLLEALEDKRADTIFKAIANKLEEHKIKLLDSTFLLRKFLPNKGVLTRNQPEARQWEDINLGLKIAKEIAGLDIGQTVAIKDKAIVAIEALEGTDNLIRRAGRITRKGAIVAKVSKPAQDMRFDVPVIGLGTVKNLARAHAAGLVIEAEKTLFIDQEKALKLADKKGIFIVAE
ncbi:MAG: UDP-2,3-diacylglucosamine diphosphatase LpxI [Candidatus Omnitrophota bacterium]